jgi:hypothetical protein
MNTDTLIAICTIAGLNIAMVAVLTTLVIWMVNKHGSEIDAMARRLDGHAGRMDRLYQMFVDLVKEGKVK